MNFYQKHILPWLLNSAMQEKCFAKYRKSVADEARGTTLEIGFGSGLNLPYYTNVSRLYALDPSTNLYTLAKDRTEKAQFPIEYIQASAEKIPLVADTIDTVISTWSLCSIPDIEAAMREIFRVLKPGGQFVFIEHGKSPEKFTAKLQKLFTPISKCIGGGCHMDREIDTLVSKAGFDIKKLEKFKEPSKFLIFMYRGVAVAIK